MIDNAFIQWPTFHTKDLISNFPYCLLYNSYDVSLENLVLEQLIIPLLIFFFILITSLLDIVRRNSVLVTNGSLRVKKSRALISKLMAELQTATFLTNKEKKLQLDFTKGTYLEDLCLALM